MILSFGDRDTELLFKRFKIQKIPFSIHKRARNKLLIINAAACENDLRIPPGNRFEKLKGNLKDYCCIRINDQWRIKFKWLAGNAIDVAITDYH